MCQPAVNAALLFGLYVSASDIGCFEPEPVSMYVLSDFCGSLPLVAGGVKPHAAAHVR